MTSRRRLGVGCPGRADADGARASRGLLGLGTVGSVLLALGGTGAGALPPSGWDLLRGSAPPAVLLCWVGVVVLCAAWWLSRGRGLAHQRTACLLWGLPLLATPPLFSRDLYAYAGQGALVAAGRDPYVEGPGALPGPLSDGVDEVWLDAPAPYGPVWLALAGLVVRLSGDSVVGALLGLRLLAVLGVALAAWALLRLTGRRAPALVAQAGRPGPTGGGAPGTGARREGKPVVLDAAAEGRASRATATSPGDPAGALWLGVANPLVLLHLVAGGHNDALMIGLLAAGVAVAASVRARWAVVVAAVLVTLAALVKVPALAGLAFLPLFTAADPRARPRAAAVTGATAAVTALAVSTATGLGWGWLGALDAGRARLSLFSPLTGLGTAVGALDAVLAAGLVLAGAVCLALLARADRTGPLEALGLALLVASVLLPVVQPWYLLWGVVLLAAGTGPRAAAALGATCLALCLTIAPSGRNVIRPPLYGLPTLLAGAVGLLVLRAAPAERPRTTAPHTS